MPTAAPARPSTSARRSTRTCLPSPTAATRNSRSAPTARAWCSARAWPDARKPGRRTSICTKRPSDGSAAPRNLTADNPAWDTQPVYLRNGDLAWLAMSRPGFEADRFRIKVMHDGAVREVAPGWDRSVQHLDVARDGRTLLATASDLGQTPLFSVDVGSGRVRRRSPGKGNVGDFAAGEARHGGAVARSRLAPRPLSTDRQGRAAPADERERGHRSRPARSAHSSSSASRAGTTKPCTATS